MRIAVIGRALTFVCYWIIIIQPVQISTWNFSCYQHHTRPRRANFTVLHFLNALISQFHWTRVLWLWQVSGVTGFGRDSHMRVHRDRANELKSTSTYTFVCCLEERCEMYSTWPVQLLPYALHCALLLSFAPIRNCCRLWQLTDIKT